jgi:hypothetical protein
MNRHATPDELARLGAVNLRPRKAARVSRHLTACARCTELNDQLSSVPTLLSSLRFPQMPASVSTRIDSILAVEAAQRVAAEPATEAGRGDLPVRAGRRRATPKPDRQGARRPAWTLPVPATRVLATAAAIVLVAIGGYEIASHTGGAAISSSSGAGAAAQTPFSSQVSFGGSVTYRQNGSAAAIEMGSSDTNFQATTLAGQAEAAVNVAKVDGVRSHPVTGDSSLAASPASSLTTPTSTGASGRLAGPANMSLASQLAGCIDRVIARGQVVLLVERAKFENKPATILVTAPAALSGTAAPKEAEIWALGQACSAANSDVLDHVKVARL